MAVGDWPVDTRVALVETGLASIQAGMNKMEASYERRGVEQALSHERLDTKMNNIRDELKGDIQKLAADVSKDMDESLDKQTKNFEGKFTDIHETLERINERLSGLDKWRWMIMGASVAIGIFLSKSVSALAGIKAIFGA